MLFVLPWTDYFNACKALSLSSCKTLLETHLFCGASYLTRATHHAVSALCHSVLSCAVSACAPKLQALPEGEPPIYLTQFPYCTALCAYTTVKTTGLKRKCWITREKRSILLPELSRLMHCVCTAIWLHNFYPPRVVRRFSDGKEPPFGETAVSGVVKALVSCRVAVNKQASSHVH